jgi:uncharacterized protein (DUF1501 family)
MTHDVGLRTDGWLNRAWSSLGGDRPIMVMQQRVPWIARGSAPALSYSHSTLPAVDAEDYQRVASLYRGHPMFAGALDEANEARTLASEAEASVSRSDRRRQPSPFVANATMAGLLLRSPYGPSICCLTRGGYDTHGDQGAAEGRFARNARDAAEGIDALVDALGPALEDTVIAVFSEFGRAALENGTGGTDHGWGGVFFVLGGGVNGGKVYGNWPGMVAGATFAKKYLEVTTDHYDLFAELMRDHMQVDEATLADVVFPATRLTSNPLGVIRT